MDQQWRTEASKDVDRLPGSLIGVRRDADVECLALANRAVESTERLLHGRRRVEVVVIEDVDVVQTESFQALVEAGEQVLARSQVAVGSGPHVPAGLGRDDEFVAQGREVLAQDATEVDFGTAVGRAVVVREVEVRDAAIEGTAQHRTRQIDRTVVAEVLPESEADRGELDTAATTAPVLHRVVAVR